MILVDKDIKKLVEEKRITIEDFDSDSITPVGYDLRIGEDVISFKKKGAEGRKHLKLNERITVEPGESVLVRTEEFLRLPRDIAGIIHSSFTFSWKGFSHISTTVDPGWEGYLWINLHNHGISQLTIERKQVFCTIVFHKTSSKAERSHSHPISRHDIYQMASAIKDREEAELKFKRYKEFLLTLTFVLFLPILAASIVMFAKPWGKAGGESIAYAALVVTLAINVANIIWSYYKNKYK